MTIYPDKLVRKIGLIDALVFFFLWFVLLGIVPLFFQDIVVPAFWLIFLGILLLPLSFFVGWRGHASVRAILEGRSRTFLWALLEGFVSGALLAFVGSLWLISSYTLAAGTGFEGLTYTQAEFWLRYAESYFVAELTGGVAGSLTACLLYPLNHKLIQRAGLVRM